MKTMQMYEHVVSENEIYSVCSRDHIFYLLPQRLLDDTFFVLVIVLTIV